MLKMVSKMMIKCLVVGLLMAKPPERKDNYPSRSAYAIPWIGGKPCLLSRPLEDSRLEWRG